MFTKFIQLGIISSLFIAHLNATSVRPTTLVLDKRHKVTQVAINNTSNKDQIFEVNVFKWTQNPDGTRNMEKINDPLLIVTPRIVSIPSGQQKKVRIAKFITDSFPESYRVLISEIPDQTKQPVNKVRATVKTIRVFNLPMFVNQKQYHSVNRVSQNSDFIRLRNPNPGYVKIRGVTYTDEQGHQAYIKRLKYILSWSTSDFGLPKTFRATRMRIEYGDNHIQTINLKH